MAFVFRDYAHGPYILRTTDPKSSVELAPKNFVDFEVKEESCNRGMHLVRFNVSKWKTNRKQAAYMECRNVGQLLEQRGKRRCLHATFEAIARCRGKRRRMDGGDGGGLCSEPDEADDDEADYKETDTERHCLDAYEDATENGTTCVHNTKINIYRFRGEPTSEPHKCVSCEYERECAATIVIDDDDS